MKSLNLKKMAYETGIPDTDITRGLGSCDPVQKTLERESAIKKAVEVYDNTSDGSRKRKIALMNWLRLSLTVEELCWVYDNTKFEDDEQRAVLEKLALFFIEDTEE